MKMIMKKLEVILLVLTFFTVPNFALDFGREDVWTSSFEQVDGEPPRGSQHHFIAEEGFLGKLHLNLLPFCNNFCVAELSSS